ncbi:MAG: hypothetical protein KDK41_17935 [Leptospiraceae bacterium]|nr:hypothetical protein [Leptospiraceae bacterium]
MVTRVRALLFSVLVLATSALIQSNMLSAQSNCKGNKTFDMIDINMSYSDRAGCFMNIKNSFEFYSANQERDRSFMLYANGMTHVFISTGDKPRASQSIGCRSFHLLPFESTKGSFSKPDSEGFIDFTTPYGVKGRVNKTTSILSLEGFNVSSQPVAHIDTMIPLQGGVEITPQPGKVVVDYGFRMGEIPVSQMHRTVTVTDGFQNKCKIKITNFMKPRAGDPYEADFIYSNSDEVKAMLSKKCPKIRWE